MVLKFYSACSTARAPTYNSVYGKWELYASEETSIDANDWAFVGTGISIGLAKSKRAVITAAPLTAENIGAFDMNIVEEYTNALCVFVSNFTEREYIINEGDLIALFWTDDLYSITECN